MATNLNYLQFGDRLRDLRAAAGLSIYALAQKSGLTRQYLGRLESGQMLPGWETACTLADALGVDLGEFRTPKKSGKKC